jgi:hypothetical protein
MSYCPKCGNKVDETMAFCPRCGGSLKADVGAQAAPQPRPTYRRDEKSEKGEKQEKNQPHNEKGEKHEKGEFGFIGWLIAGLVVIVIGVLAFVRAMNIIPGPIESAVVLLVIGIAIIVVAVWFSTMARKRSPAPST